MSPSFSPDPPAESCDGRTGGRKARERRGESSLPGRQASTPAVFWLKHGRAAGERQTQNSKDFSGGAAD